VPTCSEELLEAEMLSTVAEIIRDLLIFVGVIAALLIGLIVVVAKLPDTNPLKLFNCAMLSARSDLGGGSNCNSFGAHSRN
jgi:hypothetical protein